MTALGNTPCIKVAGLINQTLGGSCTTVVTIKGGRDAYAVARFSQWIEREGHAIIILQSDGEHTITYFCRKIKARTPSVDIVLRQSHLHSSASLGAGETLQGLLAGQFRSIKASLDNKLGQSLPITSRFWPWVVSYIGFARTRFRKSNDGSTAYSRTNGHEHGGEVCELGETVMLRIPDKKREEIQDQMGEMHLGRKK